MQKVHFSLDTFRYEIIIHAVQLNAFRKSIASEKTQMNGIRSVTEGEPMGISIDPQAVYTAADCLKILGCCRATLTKYMDQGFPLKPIGSGRAIGKDILEWLSNRPAKKQKRGGAGRKRRGTLASK